MNTIETIRNPVRDTTEARIVTDTLKGGYAVDMYGTTQDGLTVFIGRRERIRTLDGARQTANAWINRD